jgi:hypothetical protein
VLVVFYKGFALTNKNLLFANHKGRENAQGSGVTIITNRENGRALNIKEVFEAGRRKIRECGSEEGVFERHQTCSNGIKVFSPTVHGSAVVCLCSCLASHLLRCH